MEVTEKKDKDVHSKHYLLDMKTFLKKAEKLKEHARLINKPK